MAAPLEPNALVTPAQIVSQLRVMMGPFAGAMVLNEMPRGPPAARGGLRGGLKTNNSRIVGAHSGSSVRLSGDSGCETGGGGAISVEVGGGTGGGGSSHRRRVSGSGAGLIRNAASMSPWSHSLNTDDKDAVGSKSGGGGGGGGGNPGKESHPSVGRNTRNSRFASASAMDGVDAFTEGSDVTGERSVQRAAAAAMAAAAADAATAVGRVASVHTASSVDCGIHEDTALAEDANGAGRGFRDADVAVSPGGAQAEEILEHMVAIESAATAASRVSRVSLGFSNGTAAGGGDGADGVTDDSAVGGGNAGAETPYASIGSGITAGRGPASTRVDANDPRVGEAALSPEPSLLPVVDSFGLMVESSSAEKTRRLVALSPVQERVVEGKFVFKQLCCSTFDLAS